MDFLHLAMLRMALGSWQWIHQVAVGLPCKVTRGSGMTSLNSPGGSTLQRDVALGWHAIEFAQTSAILKFYFWFLFRPYHRSRHVILYTSLRNFIQLGPPSAEKITSCRFSRWRISVILDFRGPIMGSLTSLCTTSYRSSIETTALNCLVFEKIAFFAFRRQTETDRQTDRQTNRWTDPLHESALAVANGGLLIIFKELSSIQNGLRLQVMTDKKCLQICEACW